MRGLYHTLSPFTPDSAGAISVFADLPAIVIPVDMNGTVSTFWGRVGVEDVSPVRVCSALGSRELSYVMGDDEAMLDSFAEIVSSQEGEFVVLVHGPVSSLLGMDLGGLARRLEERVRMPVLAVDCSGSAFYDAGIAAALRAVLDRAEELNPRALHPQKGNFNVVGLNAVDHNDVRLRWMLAEALLRWTGGTAVSYWGCFGGWREWCYARTAERTIVMSASGARLAREMERRWAVPYLFFDELDPVELGLLSAELAEGLRLAARGRRVLAVGEQLMSNVVRNAIVGCASDDGSVTVASFFELLPERRRPQDLRLASERECGALLASGDFDLVVGDAALCDMLSADTAWYGLPHSAIAALSARDEPDAPCALSEAWWAGLADALARAGSGGARASAADMLPGREF